MIRGKAVQVVRRVGSYPIPRRSYALGYRPIVIRSNCASSVRVTIQIMQIVQTVQHPKPLIFLSMRYAKSFKIVSLTIQGLVPFNGRRGSTPLFGTMMIHKGPAVKTAGPLWNYVERMGELTA